MFDTAALQFMSDKPSAVQQGWLPCALVSSLVRTSQPVSIAPRSHWLLVVPQPEPTAPLQRKLAFQALAAQLRDFSDLVRRQVTARELEEQHAIAFLSALGWTFSDDARSVGAALRLLGWVPSDGRRWEAYRQINHLFLRGIRSGILRHSARGRRCLDVEWFDDKESCALAVVLDAMVLTGELTRTGDVPPYAYNATENPRHA